LEQDAAGAVAADDLVRDRGADHRHFDLAALGGLAGLADGIGDFVRLAEPDTDPAAAVADRHQSVETDTASAFDDLRHAPDGDDVLDEVGLLFAIAIAVHSCQ